MADLDSLTDQDDWDFDGDRLVTVRDLEVDVLERAAHRVALKHLGQHQEPLFTGVELEELVGARLAVERHAKRRRLDGDRDGVSTVAIDHTGDLALAAEATG